MINDVINMSPTREDGYIATLTTYILEETVYPENPRRKPAVIILPGSGYWKCCPREGEPVAMKYLERGYNAFVLMYSCSPDVYPKALCEVSEAVKLVRKNADKWNIDPDKIAVCGFSAGGHLAATLGTLWNREPAIKCDGSNKPNALILGYPVITSSEEYSHKGSFNYLLQERVEDKELMEFLSPEKQVSKDTPPTFLFHAYGDDCVPMENSMMFAGALKKADVPFELHIFPRGCHGFGTAEYEASPYEDVEHISQWVPLSVKWLDDLFGMEDILKNK